jgi:hypothetical protein
MENPEALAGDEVHQAAIWAEQITDMLAFVRRQTVDPTFARELEQHFFSH